jgi:predicted outer membrane protein
MKPTSRVAGLLLSGMLLIGACGDDDEDKLSDSQILGVLYSAHHAQIMVAEWARDLMADPVAVDYATQVIIHHADVLERLVVFSARTEGHEMMDSDSSVALDQAAAEECHEMAEHPVMVELRFANWQIDSNQRLIDTVDDLLLGDVRDPEVRAQIEAMRPILVDHLEDAEVLKDRVDDDVEVE